MLCQICHLSVKRISGTKFIAAKQILAKAFFPLPHKDLLNFAEGFPVSATKATQRLKSNILSESYHPINLMGQQ